jgi:hypothetical protein
LVPIVTNQTGESQQVVCYFSPDHASTAYVTIIKVGGHYVRVEGRSHARQLYLHGGELRGISSSGGVTQTGDGDYQNPLAFLDSPSDLFPSIIAPDDFTNVNTAIPSKQASSGKESKETKGSDTARSGTGSARGKRHVVAAAGARGKGAIDAKSSEIVLADAKQIVLTFKPYNVSSSATASVMIPFPRPPKYWLTRSSYHSRLLMLCCQSWAE